MKYGRMGILILMISLCTGRISSQNINKPNFALKSHETLEILRIEITDENTSIYFSLENRIVGGSFCADRNIYIIDPEGKRLKLISSTGIPVCPDSYNFRGLGEKLQFTLRFPQLKTGTKWIDLIEECESNCFWFYGITLDNDLNNKLDEAFLLASKNKPADNVTLFKNILEAVDDQNQGIEGLLYINIINAARENADNVGMNVWYKRLAASNAPRTAQYLKYLNDLGIKY